MIGLAFDTETTGLIENATLPLKKQPEVIEFYGALFNDKTGKIIEELDLLIHPALIDKITEDTTSITGITNEMLEGKPKFSEAFRPILDILQKGKFQTGHNLAFDMEMLEFEFLRPPLDQSVKALFTNPICTVEQTTHLKGIRLSLAALHEYLFNEKFEGAHRAKADVMAQVRCFVELKKRGEL